MSCSRVRRELLAQMAFNEELGPRSGPHLAHLESCVECRNEVGIDRALVRQLRRALQQRVEGSAPPTAAWELVRRRTVDSPERPWTARLVQWGGMATALAAGIMTIAVTAAPQASLAPAAQPPALVASLVKRAVPPFDQTAGWPLWDPDAYRAPDADPPLPGWPMDRALDQGSSEAVPANAVDPPIAGRMK